MHFALVHSPFVGPTTWSYVGEELRAAGHTVTIPDLRRAPPTWRAKVDACVASLPDDELVLAGHSGAGTLLPAISERRNTRAILFVDATLPPRSGEIRVGEDWVNHLRSLARDGILPRWSEIMGEQVMSVLLPDTRVRGQIERELPQLPLSYFEEPVSVPERWDSPPVAYLELSPLYSPQREEAAARGYPVDVIEGGHLHMAVDPPRVAERMLTLVEMCRV